MVISCEVCFQQCKSSRVLRKPLYFLYISNFLQHWVNCCWDILLWFTYNLDSISAILNTNTTQGRVVFFVPNFEFQLSFFKMGILNFGIMSFGLVHVDQIIHYTCTYTSLVQLAICVQVNSGFNEPDDTIPNLQSSFQPWKT
jgi:hypothetical protein